jgi:hypothetical protein
MSRKSSVSAGRRSPVASPVQSVEKKEVGQGLSGPLERDEEGKAGKLSFSNETVLFKFNKLPFFTKKTASLLLVDMEDGGQSRCAVAVAETFETAPPW